MKKDTKHRQAEEHARIQKVLFCQLGSRFDTVFFIIIIILVDDGIEDPNTAINVPSLSI